MPIIVYFLELRGKSLGDLLTGYILAPNQIKSDFLMKYIMPFLYYLILQCINIVGVNCSILNWL